jgi:hypothetical protein
MSESHLARTVDRRLRYVRATARATETFPARPRSARHGTSRQRMGGRQTPRSVRGNERFIPNVPLLPVSAALASGQRCRLTRFGGRPLSVPAPVIQERFRPAVPPGHDPAEYQVMITGGDDVVDGARLLGRGAQRHGTGPDELPARRHLGVPARLTCWASPRRPQPLAQPVAEVPESSTARSG